ncbi:hypothetical protein EMERY_62 [Brevibacillus phage Emery]|nr:hypothetical protein EMERY_62 [Brevibacillus phage Emery]
MLSFMTSKSFSSLASVSQIMSYVQIIEQISVKTTLLDMEIQKKLTTNFDK